MSAEDFFKCLTLAHPIPLDDYCDEIIHGSRTTLDSPKSIGQESLTDDGSMMSEAQWSCCLAYFSFTPLVF